MFRACWNRKPKVGIIRWMFFLIIGNVAVLMFHKLVPIQNKCWRTQGGDKEYDEANQPREFDLEQGTEAHGWETTEPTTSRTIPFVDINISVEGESRSSDEPPIPPINEKLSNFEQIVTKLRAREVRSVAPESISRAIKEKKVLSCPEINFLEQSAMKPKLRHIFWGEYFRRGELHYDVDNPIVNDVMTYTHENPAEVDLMTSDPMERKIYKAPSLNLTSAGSRFLIAADELNVLLRMQGSPGIPRLYAACLTTRDGTDVTGLDQGHLKVERIRYVLARFSENQLVCPPDSYTTQCDDLTRMVNIVRKHPTPQLAAVKLIKSFTTVFRSLWENGFFPYKLDMSNLAVTDNLDVIFTSLKSFVTLTTSQDSDSNHERAMSGVSCKDWKNCPTPGWQGQQILFRYGLHCKEVKGYCSSKSRCWGMDSHIYLCVFAKWMFPKLHYVFPTSWKHSGDVEKLLSCATQGKPDFRCSWKSFERGIDNILQLVEQTLKN